MLNLHLVAVHGNFQYVVRRGVDASERGHQNRPIRQIADTLGVGKSTVRYTLKKKESTGELRSTKKLGRPQKTTKMDECRIVSLPKKTLSQHLDLWKNTFEVVGVLSKSTNKHASTEGLPQDTTSSVKRVEEVL